MLLSDLSQTDITPKSITFIEGFTMELQGIRRVLNCYCTKLSFDFSLLCLLEMQDPLKMQHQNHQAYNNFKKDYTIPPSCGCRAKHSAAMLKEEERKRTGD